MDVPIVPTLRRIDDERCAALAFETRRTCFCIERIDAFEGVEDPPDGLVFKFAADAKYAASTPRISKLRASRDRRRSSMDSRFCLQASVSCCMAAFIHAQSGDNSCWCCPALIFSCTGEGDASTCELLFLMQFSSSAVNAS